MTFTKLADLAQAVGQLREVTRVAETLDGAQLLVRGAARSDEVGVVGVREAIGA